MSTSEISNGNVITTAFDDVSEEVRKAFKERKKAREEKEMQELMLHERSSWLRHANQAAHSSTDRLHKRGIQREGIRFIYLCHP
jgi:hypothetical protein